MTPDEAKVLLSTPMHERYNGADVETVGDYALAITKAALSTDGFDGKYGLGGSDDWYDDVAMTLALAGRLQGVTVTSDDDPEWPEYDLDLTPDIEDLPVYDEIKAWTYTVTPLNLAAHLVDQAFRTLMAAG